MFFQDVFATIRNGQIFRAALWILGEYCESKEAIEGVMQVVKQSLGELPIVDTELRAAAAGSEDEQKEKDLVENKPKVHIKTLILCSVDVHFCHFFLLLLHRLSF